MTIHANSDGVGLTMSAAKSGPQEGKRTATVLANPSATPACMLMRAVMPHKHSLTEAKATMQLLHRSTRRAMTAYSTAKMGRAMLHACQRTWVTMPCQILRLCSGGVPPAKAPSQDPVKMAANRTTHTIAAAQSVATNGPCIPPNWVVPRHLPRMQVTSTGEPAQAYHSIWPRRLRCLSLLELPEAAHAFDSRQWTQQWQAQSHMRPGDDAMQSRVTAVSCRYAVLHARTSRREAPARPKKAMFTAGMITFRLAASSS